MPAWQWARPKDAQLQPGPTISLRIKPTAWQPVTVRFKFAPELVRNDCDAAKRDVLVDGVDAAGAERRLGVPTLRHGVALLRSAQRLATLLYLKCRGGVPPAWPSAVHLSPRPGSRQIARRNANLKLLKRPEAAKFLNTAQPGCNAQRCPIEALTLS